MPDAIGIDLGTTFSCIACYKDGRPEILMDNFGKRLIESILFVDKDTGARSVGSTAYDCSPSCPHNLLRDAKRIIGRKFDDQAVMKWVNTQEKMFTIVSDSNGMAALQVTVKGKPQIITPEEVNAEILKYLKGMAEEFLGHPVTEAVISVPARFNIGQKKATKTAAELAGFNTLRLVTEPVAGTIHYVKDRGVDSKIMAFDWGGGTLDISILRVKDNTFRVEAIYGDTLCGGRDIDENLLRHFYRPVKHPDKFLRRLLEKCNNIKEQLSVSDSVTRTIDNYDGGDEDLKLFLNKTTFETINGSILQRAINIVEYALKKSILSDTDINQVVLMGGSSKIYKIREYLKTRFGHAKIKTDLNPSEAIAAGACIYAHEKIQNLPQLRKYKIIEATPYSLGIETFGGLMKVLIPKNSPMPISNCTRLQPVVNDQEVVPINIYEGERKDITFNNLLGSFSLTGLPPKAAGELTLLVTFNLDEDGILTVNAAESSSGINSELTVYMSEFHLSEQRTMGDVKEIEKIQEEDNAFEVFVHEKNMFYVKAEKILYHLNEINSESNRQKVKTLCTEFQKKLLDLKLSQREKLLRKFQSFQSKVLPRLNKHKKLVDILKQDIK